MLKTVRGRHATHAVLCTALETVHESLFFLTSDPEVTVLVALATISCEVVPLRKGGNRV